ncbi:MAG: DUF3592 domain-containing protein [Anaerolineae bacterium]
MYRTPASDRMAPWAWLVFAFAFLAAALAVVGFYGADVWHGYRSASWPSAEGRILEVDLTHYEGPKSGHTHAAWVRYQYTVGVRTYEGEQVQFPPLKERGPEAAVLARTQAAFPVGSKHDVFYDPGDPSVACLIPGISPLLLWGMVAVLAVDGAIAVWCVWRFLRRRWEG